ncbi:MAG: BatA domain-containing protein, partial [Thermogutta sp.]|uniref:BatA domain-containing protein n=1 Tax=Thermogutta sp. TaxID=1962930 RepID=UPI0019955424
MFVAPWFILGGMLAAAGVVLIHLLHRRRFRVVHWAAMEFLLQAARRSRRMIELRDWLLLLLRMACLLLFAIGMA